MHKKLLKYHKQPRRNNDLTLTAFFPIFKNLRSTECVCGHLVSTLYNTIHLETKKNCYSAKPNKTPT